MIQIQTEAMENGSHTSASEKPPPEVKFRSSCDTCLKTKVKCSQTKPSCARCNQHGRLCAYSQYRKIGRPFSWETGRRSKKQSQGQRTSRSPDQARLHGSTRDQTQNQAQQQHPKQPLLCPKLQNDIAASALTLDQVMSEAELLRSFPDSLNLEMEGLDWSGFESTYNVPAVELPLTPTSTDIFSAHRLSCDSSNQAHIDELFTSTLCRNSRESTAPTNLVHSADSSPAIQIEHLFSPCEDYSHVFPALHGTFATENIQALPANNDSSLSSISPSSSSETASWTSDSSLYSVTRSRCTLQCHVILNMHLGDLSELQANEPNTPLDVLLKLDDRIRKARDKIFGCPICLSAPNCAQTLLLVTMVVESLLSLFESGCGISSIDGGKCVPEQEVGYGRFDVGAVRDSPNNKIAKCRRRTRNYLPYTRSDLTVGTVQLDESVKVAFSTRLVRLYVDRQIAVVNILNSLLCRSGAGGNVSFKVTRELLVDIERRLECLVGFIMMTERHRIEAIC